MAEKKEEKKEYKQPTFFVRMWRETVGELRKVSWPTMQEARRLTVIVIITMISTGFVLGLLDFLFSLLIHKLFVG